MGKRKVDQVPGPSSQTKMSTTTNQNQKSVTKKGRPKKSEKIELTKVQKTKSSKSQSTTRSKSPARTPSSVPSSSHSTGHKSKSKVTGKVETPVKKRSRKPVTFQGEQRASPKLRTTKRTKSNPPQRVLMPETPVPALFRHDEDDDEDMDAIDGNGVVSVREESRATSRSWFRSCTVV